MVSIIKKKMWRKFGVNFIENETNKAFNTN